MEHTNDELFAAKVDEFLADIAAGAKAEAMRLRKSGAIDWEGLSPDSLLGVKACVKVALENVAANKLWITSGEGKKTVCNLRKF